MKRFQIHRLLPVTALLMLLTPDVSRAQAFAEGSHAVSLGHGAVTFIGTIARSFDVFDNLDHSSPGPVYFKYEYGLSDNIGLGLNVAYATNEWAYTYGDIANGGPPNEESMRRTTYSILARLNFHIGASDKFDPYVGLGLGYRDAIWRTTTTSLIGGSGLSFSGLMPLGFELTLGARYFFVDNFGLYAEIGASKSLFQGGVVIRF